MKCIIALVLLLSTASASTDSSGKTKCIPIKYNTNSMYDGLITSNDKSKYDNKMSCTWKLSTPPDKPYIHMWITKMDLEKTSSGLCTYDYVLIYYDNGDDIVRNTRKRICDKKQASKKFSWYKMAYILFKSDSSKTKTGFIMKFKFEKTPINGLCLPAAKIQSNIFEITSSHGSLYQSRSQCQWTASVRNSPYKYFHMRFVYFYLEKHPNCQYDYLQVSYNSSSVSMTEKMCGSKFILPVRNLEYLRLNFRTDGGAVKTGFMIILEFIKAESTPFCPMESYEQASDIQRLHSNNIGICTSKACTCLLPAAPIKSARRKVRFVSTFFHCTYRNFLNIEYTPEGDSNPVNETFCGSLAKRGFTTSGPVTISFRIGGQEDGFTMQITYELPGQNLSIIRAIISYWPHIVSAFGAGLVAGLLFVFSIILCRKCCVRGKLEKETSERSSSPGINTEETRAAGNQYYEAQVRFVANRNQNVTPDAGQCLSVYYEDNDNLYYNQ